MDPSEWRCACVDDMEGYNGMICRDLSNVMHQDRAGTRPSSAGVEPLRRPLAVTAGCWADTSASESACLLRGGHPTERAGSVVWACTPDPVDLSSPRWSPPLQRSAASALPEGSHMPRAEENSHWIFFVKYRSYSGILKRDPADRRGGYIPRFPAVTKV